MSPGKIIKKARDEKDWTQTQLQEKTGIFQPKISSLERGLSTPNVVEIYKLCVALEIPFTELFYATVTAKTLGAA